MKWFFIFSLLFCVNLIAFANVPFDDSGINEKGVTQINRYMTIKNGPTRSEIDPLLAVSTFNFPPSVYTVGQAIEQILSTTGYQLSSHLLVSVTNTLKKPLPITDRRLGPMTIQTALIVLMGDEVFTLQRDPLNRLVNFKVKPAMMKLLGVA